MRRPLSIVLIALGLVALAGVARAAEYAATYEPGPLPKTVAAESTIDISMKITNTGTVTWNKGFPNHIQLENHWTRPGETTWLEGGVSFPTAVGVVAPGASVTLTARAFTPAKGGNYILKWDLYAPDSVKWFSKVGVPTADQPVTVVSPLPILLKLNTAIGSKVDTLVIVPPKIDDVMGTIEPGAELVIKGTGFGSAVGVASLIFKSPTFGDKTVTVKPLEWKNKYVHGVVPDVSGFPDMLATVQVVTKDGRASELFPVTFKARRVVLTLGADDIAPDCAHTSKGDVCQGKGSRFQCGPPSVDTSGLVAGDTINAEHHSGMCVSCYWGDDHYAVTLKNGWVFHDWGWWWHTHGSTDLDRVPPVGFTLGATSATFKIHWGTGYCAWVRYGITLLIFGPEGVPFK